MNWLLPLILFSSLTQVCLAGEGPGGNYDPSRWDENPSALESLSIAPTRHVTKSVDGLDLRLKHYVRAHAQPVLLIHGLAQNDRIWDSPITKYSFARFLHASGFDVWIGNMRSAGTPGFRSDTPAGAHHWTVEDYAIYDIPRLIAEVQEQTGQAPFVIGHSLAAWALDGYFAGLSYDASGNAQPDWDLAAERQKSIRGVVTLAGVYNLWWEKSVSNATIDPLRSELDFYHSNYELELASKVKLLFYIVPNLPALPLDWIGSILSIRLSAIPWIGSELRELYQGLADSLIATPILSMFYYWPNNDPEVVRLHGIDGLEDLGPHLLEQLANAINNREATTYYHLTRPESAFEYYNALQRITLPLMFVGGGRDRLASAQMIYRDGYQEARSSDKSYLRVEDFGHLDIINGINAAKDVMAPIAKWLHEHD